MAATLKITCSLCSAAHETVVELPPGWSDITLDDDTGFCPTHAPVREFTANQCPGCVGGWGDCPLYQAFAFERYRHNQREMLRRAELKTIESGICPRRVGGTMRFTSEQIESIDLSDRAPIAAGLVLANAIREYWAKYPTCAPEHTPR
jgi:hypothetical protein